MDQTTCRDPFGAVLADQRLAAYAALAREGPIQRITLPNGVPAWLVTGYAEARQVMNDPRLVKAPTPTGMLCNQLLPDVAPGMNTHMLQADGADHARLRRLVSAAFTRRRIDLLAPRVQQIADQLLDAVADHVEFDLIAAFAYPLPMTIICDLIGVPEDARDEFRAWTTTMAAGTVAGQDVLLGAAHAEVSFARALVEAKRRQPGDDLLSALVAVRDSGDQLTDDELTSMVFLLVVAGHETTVNLIGNGVHALLTHPEQLARLRADPSLLPAAVEELLRYASPVQVTFPMLATESVHVAGVHIEAGERVLPGLLAANRDSERIEDPEKLDVGRRHNPHVAFGYGVHHCLGAPLARLEGRVALASLLNRFPNLRLAVPAEQLTWRPSFLFHGLTSLPVTPGDPTPELDRRRGDHIGQSRIAR